MANNMGAPGGSSARNATGLQDTCGAILTGCTICSPRGRLIARCHHIPSRAAHDILEAVIFEALNGITLGAGTLSRSAVGNDIVSAPVLQCCEDTADPIASIGRDALNLTVQCCLYGSEPFLKAAGIVLFAGAHLDIDKNAVLIIHGSMLLVTRAQSHRGRGRHRRVRVCAAQSFVATSVAGKAFAFIGCQYRADMLPNKSIHADVSTDQAGIHMNRVTTRQTCRLTLLHDSREDLAKDICAPSLSDTRQGRVIGKRFMQAIATKPPDRDIDLSLTQQSAVLHDPSQKARKHQPDCNLRVNAGPTIV